MAKNARILFFVIFDIVSFNVSYLLAYLTDASFGAKVSAETMSAYLSVYPAGFLILIGVKLLTMYLSSVYKIWFEHAGKQDFRRVLSALVTGTFASVTVAALFGIEPALAARVILFSFIFDIVITLGVRALYARQTSAFAGNAPEDENENERSRNIRRRYPQQKKGVRRVMIIGASRPAVDLIAEMQANETFGRKPEVVVDDESGHEGDTLLGVEIVTGRSEIRLRARRQAIDEIIIAKPDARKKQTASLLRECVKTRCQISMLTESKRGAPYADAKTASLAELRKPTVADLLGRDLPRVAHREIGDHLKGRVVLVTGGAGAFGSELCRRIIKYRPRRLIALDVDEDGLAMLSAELEEFHTAETEFRAVMASVRDITMMRRAFSAFRPHVVFHATELKQIPFAQSNPRESFLTNVLGLKTTCDLADEFAAEKFILCSTVRAANPLSVAAQCKRAAELYIAEKNEKSQTAYTSVRFPNLIEGRGNVLSVFARQIARGGPLTITDKDIVRRFMSAEEAALLTVSAYALAVGGEVFELGPGEAFEIRELAEAMIRLAGKIPYEEIDVVVTQLRAGERLFDEAENETRRTAVPSAERIFSVEDRSGVKLPHWSQLWCQDADHMDDASVMELLRLIFPTYKTKAMENTTRGVKIENEQ